MPWEITFSVLIIFILGYLAIIFEEPLRINKTASALVTAGLAWMTLFIADGGDHLFALHSLTEHVAQVSEIVLFLLAAMAIVELVDSHRGFRVITQMISTRSRRPLLWILSTVTFFLSAALDNLTTTIVMVSLLRKLIPSREERLLFGCAVVISANAGGAWTPIGDVTTTMLWIGDRVSTAPTIAWLFLPSLAVLVVSTLYTSRGLQGVIPVQDHYEAPPLEPGARLILPLGLASLISIPVFKALTGLPPYMGALIGLGLLWILTDALHHQHEDRSHLRIPHILSRIDTPGVLFFLGILLSVAALEVTGALTAAAQWLHEHLNSPVILTTLIGALSSIVDNVPLVAASMAMYSPVDYPPDSLFWQLLALCAGTGGSLLLIGSAAGVALMGMERISFLWYARRASLSALLGYAAGILTYLGLRAFF